MKIKTLEDVAKLSGVSRSTVSRVINDDPSVSAATRERVKGIVRQLNFKPNAAARGLASGRTRVLGVLLPQGVVALFSDPYFPILIQGMAMASSASDYAMMLWLAQPANERGTIHQMLRGGLSDGLIVSSVLLDDPIVPALVASGTPFLVVGRHPGYPEINYVDCDNHQGADEAVSHLLRLGRRRVATVTGPLNTIAGLDRPTRPGWQKRTIPRPAVIWRRSGCCPSTRTAFLPRVMSWRSAPYGPCATRAAACRRTWPWWGLTICRSRRAPSRR